MPTSQTPPQHLSPGELLDEMKSVVSYLRVDPREQADPEQEWLSCDDLVNNGSRLLEVVRSTAAGRGTDRDDIAMSLFAQAYAFRVASIAIGSQLLGDKPLDVSPGNLAIALGRHRPNAVVMDEIRFAVEPLETALWDQHLVPFVHTAHEVARTEADNRVGIAMLWGNVATGCASAFGAFGHAGPTTAPFFDAAPEQVRAAGRYVETTDETGEATFNWERNSCCLWFQVSGDEPSYCGDCPKKPVA